MSYPPRVVLREVVDSDLPIFFEHQRDPEAVRMAAFPSRDHDAFMTHWAKLRREPSNIIRTIVCDGQVAGNIGSWIAEDQRLIGYWIGREFWGRGVATAALAAFVAEVKERPLHAFVAKHNVGSIRVLEKCEFAPSPEHDPSIAGEDGIHEVLYMLSLRGTRRLGIQLGAHQPEARIRGNLPALRPNKGSSRQVMGANGYRGSEMKLTTRNVLK
jgi:RimJ/RimL family protein N-acetyltransferase